MITINSGHFFLLKMNEILEVRMKLREGVVTGDGLLVSIYLWGGEGWGPVEEEATAWNKHFSLFVCLNFIGLWAAPLLITHYK